MFKTTILTRGMTMIVLLVALCSFASLPGGDSFQVYLNDKLILEQHLYEKQPVWSISLNQNSQDQLSVNYSHCGVLGTARTIRLRDEDNTVLREWKFPDAPGSKKDPMICAVKDIAASGKGHDKLKLSYSATERAEECVLVSIEWTNTTAHK